MQKATDDQGETPEQEIERIRESAGRTIGVLRAEIDHLRAVVLPHARIQSHADGFQVGWHSAIDRFREGDTSDELRALVPDTRKKPLPAGLMKETDADQGKLAPAAEYVHHLADCPAIGGNGDADCRCGAVEFLAVIESQSAQLSAAVGRLAAITAAADAFASGDISSGKLAEVLGCSDKHGFKTSAHAFCDQQVGCETDSAPSKDQELEKKEDSGARSGRDLSASHPEPPREVCKYCGQQMGAKACQDYLDELERNP